MALIWSVYWPTADKRGPDLDAMNRIVEVDDEIARQRAGSPGYPGDGTARWPTQEELAAYEQQRAAQEKADQAEDLTTLTKAELLDLLPEDARAEVPPRATKADIADLVEQHRAAQQDTAEADGAGGPEVTAAPGAGEPAARVTDPDGNDVG